MSVGIQLGSIVDEIGSSDFFHAFFSTISGNLETAGWGTRFPVLLNKLYGGALTQKDAEAALMELEEARRCLSHLPPNKVIWDIENLEMSPPWGENISSDITDMSNYFVSSTGRDLFQLLKEVIEELRDAGGTAKIVTI